MQVMTMPKAPYVFCRDGAAPSLCGDGPRIIAPGGRPIFVPMSAVLKVRWQLEMWPNIEEDLRSDVLRSDPRRYGRPLRITDPSLLSRFTPRRVMSRVLGWDEEPDPNWVNVDIAAALGLRPGHQRFVYDAGFNLVTDAGENVTAKKLTGNVATSLDNTNANLGVSSNTVAAAETDTSIPTATWVGMNATYPVNPSGSSFSLQSDFTTAVANFAWNRWGIANGNNPPTTGSLFSNVTQSLGTKSSGTWTLTATVSID